ncbi:sulfur transfer complex subunit TusD [Salmonella enterica subsp. enterica]|uniref:Sulfur transfer complex subunit TusD n=1 Tax=Salmonella enterica I TaxID=59201 RepID=A0A379WLK3_SALET|nr:sulfur transfer complex subunit TusD [Salmonella enterica subsp. enterica]
MRYAIMVTGPAYGTQQASSALQFAHALLNEGHELASVFFYREGVYNANLLTSRRAMNMIWYAPGRN